MNTYSAEVVVEARFHAGWDRPRINDGRPQFPAALNWEIQVVNIGAQVRLAAGVARPDRDVVQRLEVQEIRPQRRLHDGARARTG